MERQMKIAFSLVLLGAIVLIPARARADAAPPYQPPGSNPQPGGEQTQVRMLAETVQIEVQASTPAGSWGRAVVSADFTMRNLGEVAESMAVRFPISCNDGYYNYPEITDLVVKVDGTKVPTRRDTTEDPDNPSGRLAWASFEVTFPPGQDVSLQVTYTLEGRGDYSNYVSFVYLLETGAGWKETIGSAEIIVRLPYEANPQNVMLEEGTGWSSTTPGGRMVGNEIRWHYTDLEPARENNMEISLVKPSVWKAVLTKRMNVASNPNDGEAWGRLGAAYGDISYLNRYYRQDAAGLELYALAVQALEKAVALLPDDPRWHIEFASLLYWHYLWTAYSGFDAVPDSEIMRALQELDQALVLAPQDEQLLELVNNISYTFPEMVQPSDTGYVLLWLTATPTTHPTNTPLLPTAAATATPPHDETATPPGESFTPTQVPTGRNPLCATILLAPLAVGLVFLRLRNRKRGT